MQAQHDVDLYATIENNCSRLNEDDHDDRPRSLDDLLRDYDADKVKTLTAGFTDEPPAGKEII